MVGSPFWIPPEMIQNHPHNMKVDIWGLGVCIIEMITGNPPNRQNSIKAMYVIGTQGLSQYIIPEWSNEMRDFLTLCLKFDPEERPNANELLEHPFMQKTTSSKDIEHLLLTIFLQKTITSGGLF